MKLSKSAAPKIYRDFSLPKIQLKILNNVNNINNQLQRLNFPMRDDSSLVAGVGRRHFNINNYSSVKKIINPEFKQYQIKNINNIGQLSMQKLKTNKKIMNPLERKLNLGVDYNSIRTEVNQPPYARDYNSKEYRQKIQRNQRQKTQYKQHFKLKTQLDVRDIDRNKYSKKIVTISNQSEQYPQKYYSIQQSKSKPSSMREYLGKKNENLLYKMYSIPQPMQSLNKLQPRIYNTTYISSEF